MDKYPLALKKGLAIASLVLGLFLWIPVFGIVCSGLALIFGISSLVNRHKEPENYGGKIFSITGIILGCIGMLFPFILPIFLVLAGAAGMMRFLAYWGFIDVMLPMYGLTIMFFFLMSALLGFTRLKIFVKSIIALISGSIISMLIVLPGAFSPYPAAINIVEILTRILELTYPVIENFVLALIPLALLLRKRSFYITQVLLIAAVLVFESIFVADSGLTALFVGLTLVFSIFPVQVLLFQYYRLLKKIKPAVLQILSIIALVIIAFRLIYSFLIFGALSGLYGPELTTMLIAGLAIGIVIWSIFTIRLFWKPDFYQTGS